MIRRSLFTKLFLGNLLILVLIVSASGIVAYVSLEDYVSALSAAHQERVAALLARMVESLGPAPEPTLDRMVKGLARPKDAPGIDVAEALPYADVRLTLVAADGHVMADSVADPLTMRNHRTPDRRELLAAFEGRPGIDIRRSDTLGVWFRYVARPVVRNGQVVAAARTAMPLKGLAQGTGVLRNVLFWASVTALAAGVLLAVFINGIWYAPLRRITIAARRIAAGNLGGRARITGSDELAQLGTALNAMRDNLAGQIRLISAQREDLRTVVNNLREGVLALDAEEHIVLMNQAARDLLTPEAEEDAVGRHIQAVVRIADVVEIYEEAVRGGRPAGRQIEVEQRGQRRHLDVHATPLTLPRANEIGGLLVVRDVTDLARTAAVKAEFVANASHELRTPLATVRAAVDSLLAVPPDDVEALEKISSILDRHVARLENLTIDLLDLHIVEGTRKPLALSEIRLGALADWLRSNFALKAADKQVRLDVQTEDPEHALRSDRKLLELILHNLVDNAIKFTPPGGRVECRLQRDTATVEMCVADTGCGIRPEDQPRVFERFYQADTSRSGDAQMRGTGLGLAIVKHAAERLGAQVRLESELGRGTTVCVGVPDRGAAVV